ncbi:MAG: 2-succinyl-6-hydroxy-2,4-cyclohexadiene-1-carboxylate synthase [Melioribacteraceae bacterium]
MILKIDNLNFNLICDEKILHSKIPIIFLHGFTGNINDWEFLENKIPQKFTPIFIDLIGHGKTSSPDNAELYSSKSQIIFLKNIIDELKLNEIILCGYSMGGRLALEFSYKYPQNVKSLILESTSFGIEDKNERTDRIKNDIKIAENLKRISLEEFLDFWFELPLFNSLKNLHEEKLLKIKKERLFSNNKIGLRNSLLGFSTGKMKNYFLHASKFKMNILLINGELDTKFTQIGEKVIPFLPNGKLEIVKDAGHNIHLEKPEEFLKLLNKFLLNI